MLIILQVHHVQETNGLGKDVMPKNDLLEKYPELWRIEGDWDDNNRAIKSSSLSHHQLERLPFAGEELWVKVASHGESNGKMVSVPWDLDMTMAAALVRAIEPGKRAQWVAVSSADKMTGIAIYSGNSGSEISVQEMIFVSATQLKLFPHEEPETETKAA